MNGRPPASPQELNTDFICFRRAVVGSAADDSDRNSYGQQQYSYVKRRTFKAKVMRQKASSIELEKQNVLHYAETAVTNWLDCREFQPDDVLMRCSDRKQFVVNGDIVNWQNRNRWGLLPLVENPKCVENIDDCHVEQPETLPKGTADQDQRLPAE